MKTILIWLLGCLCAFGAEAFRVWENNKEQKLEARLIGITDKKVHLQTKKGKYWVDKDTLSALDQKYLATINPADFLDDADFEVRIQNITSGKRGESGDKVKLKFSAEKVQGRRYTIICVFLGPKGKSVEPFKVKTQPIDEDGDYFFDVAYSIEPWDKDEDRFPRHDYKGYVIGVFERGDFGPELLWHKGNHASYVRFLDPLQEERVKKILDSLE